MGTIKNPICPYCHTKMVSIWYECDDGSGWNLMWSCSCVDVGEIEKKYTMLHDKREKERAEWQEAAKILERRSED